MLHISVGEAVYMTFLAAVLCESVVSVCPEGVPVGDSGRDMIYAADLAVSRQLGAVSPGLVAVEEDAVIRAENVLELRRYLHNLDLAL